ncbi:hypothetical protein LB503_011473 [Fusarium chuoi]|nr:hypothetical protein LB503_011473 [Fusarium chuoi]
MSSSTTSIPGSDTGSNSHTPSLQTQSSLTESSCKSGTNKPGRPQLTLMITEDQHDISSEVLGDQDIVSSEVPSVVVQALRARQWGRKLRTFDKDYKGHRSNWESVKLQWSLLCMFSMVYKAVEGEKGWPAEWDDEAAFTYFLEETVASWVENLPDGNRVILKELAAILGESWAVDLSSDAAVKEYQDRVRKFVDDNMAPVPEEDQGLEELELMDLH